MTLETVPCDLCGGQTFIPLYPGTISNPEANPAAYYSSSRTQAGYLPIVRCATCGLVMTNPRDDTITLQHVYAQLADAAYEAEEHNRRQTAQAYLAMVRQFCPPPGSLLDAGCATGIFACEASAAGWHVTGLEPSAWAIARARTRCAAVNWLQNSLEAASLSTESFEAVTLWDVLEHVHSPIATFSIVHRWLKPGGGLFLNLPNIESVMARLLGPRWVLLLREHLWYFSPTTLRRLLDQTGFTLVRTRPNFVRFSLANIAARLGQYPGPLHAASRCLAHSALLARFPLTFPMGEMTVVARRNF